MCAQAPALLYGARGGITGASNCMCTPLVRVHELAKEGKYTQAVREHQRPFNRANDVLGFTGNKQVQGFKQVLQWQGLISHTTCMAREDLSDEEIAAFRAKVASDPLLGPTLVL